MVSRVRVGQYEYEVRCGRCGTVRSGRYGTVRYGRSGFVRYQCLVRSASAWFSLSVGRLRVRFRVESVVESVGRSVGPA